MVEAAGKTGDEAGVPRGVGPPAALVRKGGGLVDAPLRRGDNKLVDAPDRRVVGAKGKSPF